MRVLLSSPLPRAASTLLREKGMVVETLKGFTDEALRRRVPRADALICLLSHAIDRRVLDAGKRLRVVSLYAAGYNNVDWKTAFQRKIWVTHTPDALTEATADLTWALILSVTRRVIPADAFLRAGRFRGWEPALFLGTGLQGKTLGLFGMGRIGRAAARRALAFGMKVIYRNRRPVPRKILAEEGLQGVRRVSFSELLRRSDVISLHAPLTSETRGRFGRDEFLRMKKGAYFINTARGAMMDEGALAHALRSHKLAGAGLDVYEREPHVTRGLLGMEQVVLLPHIGSAARETRERMALSAAEDVLRVLSGKSPRRPIPETPPGFRSRRFATL